MDRYPDKTMKLGSRSINIDNQNPDFPYFLYLSEPCWFWGRSHGVGAGSVWASERQMTSGLGSSYKNEIWFKLLYNSYKSLCWPVCPSVGLSVRRSLSAKTHR